MCMSALLTVLRVKDTIRQKWKSQDFPKMAKIVAELQNLPTK